MKKYLQLGVIAVLAVLSLNATAQKFGHINTVELVTMLPERDSAMAQLQRYNGMLQQELDALQMEYQTKLQAYQEKYDTYSDLVRQSKESELNDMGRRIQEFRSTAQQDIGQKENELLQPIMEKVQNAITSVGEENGFLYIFDISAGAVLFNSDDSVDVLPLVKAKLGIQ